MTPEGLTVVTLIQPGLDSALRTLLELDSSRNIFNSRCKTCKTLHYAAFVIIPSVRRRRFRLPWETDPATGKKRFRLPWENLDTGKKRFSLVLETNFDGPLDQHINELIARVGALLDAIYSHCTGYQAEPDKAKYLRDNSRKSAARFVAFPERSLRSIRNAIAVNLATRRYLKSRQSKRSLAVGQQTEQQIFADIVHHFRTKSRVQPIAESVTQETLRWRRLLNLLILVPNIFWYSIILAVCLPITFIYERLEAKKKYDDAVCHPESHDGMNVGPQNHLCTVSMVKPSLFRKFLLRFVLSLVRDGADKIFLLSKLGEMTSIHFARWLLIDGTLVFLSNYDGSWSSYLGDFSHQGFGINAIWSNTISFPPTLFLFGEGSYDLAKEEYRVVRHFHPAPVFYPAYGNYPVTNILQYVNFRDRLASAIAQAERLELSMETFRKVSRDQIQGLVASGYNNLDHVCFLFLKIERVPEAKKWLDSVVAEKLTTAIRPSGGRSSTCLNIGFSWKGLARLVPAQALQGFPPEFVLGMNRQGAGLVLGDTGMSAESNWEFGGSNPEKEVHVLLMLYAETPVSLTTFANQVCGTNEFAQGFSEVVSRQESHRTKGDESEPFGYRDGISQPQVLGFGRGRSTEEEDCKTGEFVLGYENVFGKIAQGPSIVHAGDHGRLLPDTPNQPGQKALGFNGTYLVFRKLEQDVAGFTSWLNNQSDQTGGKMDPELLAAKIMGRWRSGAPLMQASHRDDPKLGQSNNFNFSNDPNGLVCPVGAHIRRANPRDSLPFSPDTSVKLSNHHRIIRRGRKYFEPGSGGSGSSPNPNSGDSSWSVKPTVGLYFIAINADLRRQFEFIQQTWLNNPTFNGLERNKDPIVGDHSAGGVFTIPSTPVHQELDGLQRFVTVRGGGYFFLPSKNALSYVANYP